MGCKVKKKEKTLEEKWKDLFDFAKKEIYDPEKTINLIQDARVLISEKRDNISGDTEKEVLEELQKLPELIKIMFQISRKEGFNLKVAELLVGEILKERSYEGQYS